MTDMRATLTVDADASAIVGEMDRAGKSVAGLGRETTRTGINTEAFGRKVKSASESASVFERESTEAKRAIEQLQMSLDPAARAARQYEVAEENVNRALRSGAISKDEAARTMALLEAQYGRTGTAGRRFGGNIQNVAFQVGDFATQVGAGTSASMALGQQLPQLLGGFGAVGAVMGAVVAIGVPLAAALFRSGEAARSADDALGELEAASDNARTALDNQKASVTDIAEEYGVYTQEVRELLGALAEMAVSEQVSKLTEAVQSLDPGPLDQAVGLMERIEGATGPAALGVAGLRGELDRIPAPVRSAAEAYAELQEADTTEEQVEGARDLRLQLEALNDTSFKDLIKSLALLEQQGTRALGSVREAAIAAALQGAAGGGRGDAGPGGLLIGSNEFRLFETLGYVPDGEPTTGDAGSSRSGSSGSGGGSRDVSTLVSSIEREMAKLDPSFGRAADAADRWRAETLEDLAEAGLAHGQYAEDVEAIYADKLAEAYAADLERRGDWAAGTERALRDIEQDLITWADVSENLVTGWSDGLEDAFVELNRTGKLEIGDLVDYTLEQFARLAFQQSVQPAITGIFDAVAGIFAPTPTSHTGSPGVMQSAPGGPRGDETLTMIRKDEKVFTPRQLDNAGALVARLAGIAARPGGAGQTLVKVSVTNQSSRARVEAREAPGGGVQIDVMDQIERGLAGSVSRGNSPLARSIATTFGLSSAGRRGAR